MSDQLVFVVDVSIGISSVPRLLQDEDCLKTRPNLWRQSKRPSAIYRLLR